MIPRSSKSIFTLGEEGGMENEEVTNIAAIREPKSSKASSAELVGLRILIQFSGKKESNVVVKSSVMRSSMPVARARQYSPAGLPELSFLKACFFCKKELSPQKDVYMYRGDQGFCSVECRCRQILLDERRDELEASRKRERLATHHRPRPGPLVREPDRRRRILATA